MGAGDTNQTGNNSRATPVLCHVSTPRIVSPSTELTVFHGSATNEVFLGQTLGGWQVSTVVKLSKGTPFTVITAPVSTSTGCFSEARPVLLDPSYGLGHSAHQRPQ